MNTVKRAIWGEPNAAENETGGQEPVSGEMGNTAAGEPYDAGNKSDPKSDTTAENRAPTTAREPASTSSTTDYGATNPISTSTTSSGPTNDKTSAPLPGAATHPSNTTKGTSSDPLTDLSTVKSHPAKNDEPAAKAHEGIDVNREDSSAPAGSSQTQGTSSTAQQSTSGGQPGNIGAAGGKGEGDMRPPAQEMTFTKDEIDEAANVNKSHQNPHTIGDDGKEENIDEELGEEGDVVVKDEDGTPGKEGGKEKGKMGMRMDKMKQKLHLGGKGSS